MEEDRIKAFCSNDAHLLLQMFLVDFLQARKTPSQPLYLVVPTPKIAASLLKKIAENSPYTAAFGVEILTIEQAVQKFFQLLFQEAHYLPDRLDFAIEMLAFLKSEAPTLSSTEQQEFAKRAQNTLYRWLWEGEEEERATPFYTLVSRLWQKLKSEKTGWLFLHDALATLQQKEVSVHVKEIPALFLFGFSFLNNVEHAFFSHLASHFCVYSYILSPCMMFWEDIVSDREGMKIQAEKKSQKIAEKLEELIFDRHPLLANFGKKGRTYAALLEEAAPHRKEIFRIKSAVKKHPAYQELPVEGVLASEETNEDISEDIEELPTLLHCLQADLLFLQGRRKEKIALEQSAISVHAAPTKLREVEVLYENIVRQLNKDNHALFEPGCVVVMAPCIDEYLPYIERVFKAHHLPFQVLGTKKTGCKNRATSCRAFFDLLHLPKERFSCESIQALFEVDEFLSPQKIEREKKASIPRFFRKIGFRWAKDGKQRGELFEKEGYKKGTFFSEKGTWSEVRQAFIKNLQQGVNEEEETFARVVFAVDALFSSFEKLQGEHTLLFFVDHFRTLLERFFDFPGNEAELFEKALLTFEKKAEHQKNTFFLEEAAHFFKEIYEKVEEEALRTQFFTAPVLCATVGDITPLACDHLFLLGFDDEQFPRQKMGREQSEKDKYFFIEALIGARKSLSISYLNYSFEEHVKKEPALCVQALLKEIAENFQLPASPFIQHPLYIPKSGAHLSFSQKRAFEDHYTLTQDEELDVKEFISCFKVPLKSYYERQQGLFLSQYQEKKSSFLSFERYDLAKLYRESLTRSQAEYEACVRMEPKLPENSFHDPYLLHTKKMQEELQNAAKKVGVEEVGTEKCRPVEIEFTPLVKTPEWVGEDHLLFPEVVSLVDGHTIRLRGTLASVYPKESLFFERYSDEALIRAFGMLLLRHHVGTSSEMKKTGYFQTAIHHFLRDKKSIALPLEKVDLKEYLLYAIQCRKQPSLLYPHLIKHFFEDDREKIKQEIEKERAQEMDPYLAYHAEHGKIEGQLASFEAYQKKAEKLFSPLFSGENV